MAWRFGISAKITLTAVEKLTGLGERLLLSVRNYNYWISLRETQLTS